MQAADDDFTFYLWPRITLTVRARSALLARQMLGPALNGAHGAFGCWPDGAPVLAVLDLTADDACLPAPAAGAPGGDPEDQAPRMCALAAQLRALAAALFETSVPAPLLCRMQALATELQDASLPRAAGAGDVADGPRRGAP